MKIEKFDSNSVNQILDPLLLQALVPIAEKYGLKVRSQAGRFTSYKWTAKFEFVAPEGAVESDNEIGRRLGAKFDVGFEFTAKGKTYRVTGFNAKRPKNDTEITRLDNGKVYVCHHSYPNWYVNLSTAK